MLYKQRRKLNFTNMFTSIFDVLNLTGIKDPVWNVIGKFFHHGSLSYNFTLVTSVVQRRREILRRLFFGLERNPYTTHSYIPSCIKVKQWQCAAWRIPWLSNLSTWLLSLLHWRRILLVSFSRAWTQYSSTLSLLESNTSSSSSESAWPNIKYENITGMRMIISSLSATSQSMF